MKRIALIALLLLTAGCEHMFPHEPHPIPPCKWVPLVDQNGKTIGYTLAPGQVIGVIVTCDKTQGYPK